MGYKFKINTEMNDTPIKNEPNKDNNDNAVLKVVDHIIIKDKTTGKNIINVRG